MNKNIILDCRVELNHYLKVSLIVFFLVSICSLPTHAQELKKEHITALTGMSMGVVSSSSCGRDTALANKAKRVLFRLWDHEFDLGKMSDADVRKHKTIAIKLRDRDQVKTHAAGVCDSARDYLNVFTRR